MKLGYLFDDHVAAEELIFEPTRRKMEDIMSPLFTGKVRTLPFWLEEEDGALLGTSSDMQLIVEAGIEPL